MAELTPQEQFNQLLSFLKDPKNQIYKRNDNFHGIWSLSFPNLSLEDDIWLEGRSHSNLTVQDILKEAIEIMESEMFQDGFLKGNQRTPNILINRLECFVLQMAAALKLNKIYVANSPELRFHDLDNRPKLVEHIESVCNKLASSFDKAATLMIKYGLNRPDRIIHQRADLIALINDAKIRALKKENIQVFFLVQELIRIFIINIPHAPNNLIAHHITNFINKGREHTFKNFTSLWQDTVRQQVRKERMEVFIIPAS